MTKSRRVAVITGGRPDYGLLRPLMRKLDDDAAFDLQIVATGMHLIPEQGETWRLIEEDGFSITEKVSMTFSGDTPTSISKAIGSGVSGMASAFERLQPDMVILLGDRYETLAAAVAAMVGRLAIAHIHGGEATEGLIDEPIRHSISKMAHIHFTATEDYRRRVIQLGEQPDRVFHVGAIGLDNVREIQLLDRPALEQALDFELRRLTFLVTYHPVTLESGTSMGATDALISALDHFPQARIVITLPNADTDSADIRARLIDYTNGNADRVAAFAALGTERYLSLLSQCNVVIGNSSSGLIEAPSFKVPTVNIGDRQRGRIAPRSVIHSAPDSESIREAIATAIDDKFRLSLNDLVNPYGDGRTANRIVEILRHVTLDENLLKKRFFDLPNVAA